MGCIFCFGIIEDLDAYFDGYFCLLAVETRDNIFVARKSCTIELSNVHSLDNCIMALVITSLCGGREQGCFPGRVVTCERCDLSSRTSELSAVTSI